MLCPSIRRLRRGSTLFSLILLLGFATVVKQIYTELYSDSQPTLEPFHADVTSKPSKEKFYLSAREHFVQKRNETLFVKVESIVNNIDSRQRNITSFVDLPINFNYTHKVQKIEYTILWFNPAEWIVRRNRKYRLDTCEYNNCRVTEDRSFMHNSSAVIFGLTMSNMGFKPPVSRGDRNPDQIWVFESLEPPIYHIFTTDYKQPAWHNTMNWSMTNNLDSDVLAPFGTFKTNLDTRQKDYEAIYSMKTKMALWVVSNCATMSKRPQYVTALQKAGLEVDIYGSCGKGRYNGDLKELARPYLFYLSFENSFCKYYITEKVFRRYNFDLLLITRGGANYSQLMPEGSFIDTASFPNVTSVVRHLVELGSDKQRYIEMLRQKDRYIALDGEKFGHPYGMCDLCKKLNFFDGKRKTYGNLEDEVLKLGRCTHPKDIVIR